MALVKFFLIFDSKLYFHLIFFSEAAAYAYSLCLPGIY